MKNRIAAIRKELGLTQEGLAELVGTSKQQIYFLENGKRGLDTDWINRIAKALKVEPWVILKDPSSMNLGTREHEIISRYNALQPALKAAVDAILFSEDK